MRLGLNFVSLVIFYLAFATSSLLIILRVYVLHVLRLRFRSTVLMEARKYRHLEQGQDCSCNFNGHMDGKLCASRSWYVPPTDYERMFLKVPIWLISQVSYG